MSDTTWTTLALLVTIAVIVVVAIVFGRGLTVKRGGLNVEVDPSKQPPHAPPDLEAEDVDGSAGKAVVRDEAGGRMKVKGVHGEKGAEVVRTGEGGDPTSSPRAP